MTTNEDAPAMAENAEPVEASLALALDAVWTNLASASGCLDRWHEAGKPTAALPVTGPGAAFVAFLRMAAELSVLNGPEDVAVAEVCDAMLPVAETYFGFVEERVELVEGLAPQLLAMLRHHAVASSANDLAKKCAVLGIAADWTELHAGVVARHRAAPNGKVQLADMEVFAAEELLGMVRRWDADGQPRVVLAADRACTEWLFNLTLLLPEATPELAHDVAVMVLGNDPAEVQKMVAASRAGSLSKVCAAMMWTANEWWSLHTNVVDGASRGDGPVVLSTTERRLARELIDAAVAWDDGGRPTVLPMDAAAGVWLAERRAWIPEDRSGPVAHEHALELLLTNPLELVPPVAPAAPVDPAAV